MRQDMKLPALTQKMFSGQPNKQTGGKTWSLTKDFFIELLVLNNLHIHITATHVVAATNGSVLVSVTVDIKTDKGIVVSSGCGSSMSVPGEERYSSSAQKAVTFSMKAAMELWGGITTDVVLDMMKQANIDPGKVSTGTGFGTMPDEPTPIVAELTEDDNLEM